MEDLKQRVEKINTALVEILEMDEAGNLDLSEAVSMINSCAKLIKDLQEREAKILTAWEKFKPWAISTIDSDSFNNLRVALEELGIANKGEV